MTSEGESENMQTLIDQIQEITTQFQASEVKRIELEQRIENMNSSHEYRAEAQCEFPDIEPELTSGDQIQLESFKAIPEYSGKRHEYRSWRNQIARRMKLIDQFQKHPKYEAALAIIRAKITGAAADILTNNKTPYNIRCIVQALDAAYTDQRPLYAIEAQMVAIKQNDKNLHELYNAINFALNAIIMKITTTYKIEDEQRSLIAETTKKAIRTFIVGLKFRTMRHILYGQQPKTLSEAYAIAQTVFYDNEHLQLENTSTESRVQSRGNTNKPRNNWNQQYNNYQQRNTNTFTRPEPMDMGNSNNTKWRQPESPQKREYDSSRQRFEQPRKLQRINTNQEISGNLISNDSADSDDATQTNTSSAFLDE